MIDALTNTPLFGVVLCIAAFYGASWVSRKCRSPLVNPLLVGAAVAILFLQATGIPLEKFNTGADMIAMLVAPATAALAVSIYRQIEVLKRNFLPIVGGSLVGALTAMGSVTLMCKLMGLDDQLFASLLPKSVTTAIALELSTGRGGLGSITALATLVTGVTGAVFAPLWIKLFRIKSPVAQGVAIGVSSHAVGTTKAITIGDVQGAMSGIAIGVAGLLTGFLSLLFG